MTGQQPRQAGRGAVGGTTSGVMGGTMDGAEDADARRSRRAARTGLVLWVVALVVGTALFHAIGDGPLSAPPLDPAAWSAWAEGRDPLVAVFAVLRLLVLALSWYLVGATSVGILARVLRAASLVRIADALTVPALRRSLQAALGVSLATAMVVSSVPTLDPSPREISTVALGAADDDLVRFAAVQDVAQDVAQDVTRGGAQDVAQVTLVAAGEGDRITLRHVESVDPPVPLPLELLERARDAAAGGSPDGPPSPSPQDPVAERDEDRNPRQGSGDGGASENQASTDHSVVAGESFWTIAQDVLAGQLDRAPSDAEVVTYWGALVESNRDRLVDRDNPDLIFPGQLLQIPSVGAASTDVG